MHTKDRRKSFNTRNSFAEVELLLSTCLNFAIFFIGKHNGSISAEHGIGFKKTKHMHYSRSPEAIEVMKKLKNLFDPKVYS